MIVYVIKSQLSKTTWLVEDGNAVLNVSINYNQVNLPLVGTIHTRQTPTKPNLAVRKGLEPDLDVPARVLAKFEEMKIERLLG